MVEKRGPADHGDEEATRLPAHEGFEDARPSGFAVCFRQRVVSQSLVGPAGAGLGCAAQDAVQDEEPEHPHSAGREGKHSHLGDHERGVHNHNTLASYDIGQCARGDFQHDDDHGPDDIEQCVLLEGKPEIEEEDADDRVVEPRVKKDTKGDKEREVAVEGGGHGNLFSHR